MNTPIGLIFDNDQNTSKNSLLLGSNLGNFLKFEIRIQNFEFSKGN